MADSRPHLCADAVNDGLHRLYSELWSRLVDVLPDDESFSNPLLIKVKREYCDAPKRIVVVGQQTDTWYNEVRARASRDPVAMLMEIYSRFDLARPHPARRSSPYWWASHHISEQLNGTDPRWDFVWTDLVRIDQNRARVSRQIETKLCALGLLRSELELLHPDVVIFFTGPSYESRLRETFLDLMFTAAIPHLETRWLARVSHPALPAMTVRTYHPGYLQRVARYDVVKMIPSLVR